MPTKMGLDKNRSTASHLRDVAEEKLGKLQNATLNVEEKTTEEIVHELQVHQIELEIQNEELRRVQLELEASKDKYQDLYEFAPVGYFTLTHKGIIIDVNLAGTTLLGAPRSKLVKRGFGRFVTPECQDTWFQHLISVTRQEEKQTCDVTLKCGDGSLLYAGLESIRTDAPVGDEGEQSQPYQIRMALTDITDRKMAKALRESEAKYWTIANFTYDWEYWVGADGNLLYCSPSCERITGYRAQEFLDDPDLINRIIHPDDCAEILAHFHKTRQVNHHIADSKDFRIIRRDGETRWIGHVCQPVYDKKGIFSGRRGSNRDITERKQLEKDRDDLIIELQQALSNVKKLSGFLPICAACKKIRDDTGYWNEIERYISEHSETQFTHGICPECMRKLYPEIADEIAGPLETDQEK
jgi:PAS domain S-box-containing protein